MNFLEEDFQRGVEYDFFFIGQPYISVTRKIVKYVPGNNTVLVMGEGMNHPETINLNEVLRVEATKPPQTGSSKRRKSIKKRKSTKKRRTRRYKR
jgi:hypothetical protein